MFDTNSARSNDTTPCPSTKIAPPNLSPLEFRAQFCSLRLLVRFGLLHGTQHSPIKMKLRDAQPCDTTATADRDCSASSAMVMHEAAASHHQ
jgi:hypothetical protein